VPISLNESIVEDAALIMPAATLTRPLPRGEGSELGYAVGHGPQLAPGEYAGGTLTPALSQGERESYAEVVQFRFARTLTLPLPRGEESGRLREAIRRLNPAIPQSRSLAALLPKLLSGELSVAAVADSI